METNLCTEYNPIWNLLIYTLLMESSSLDFIVVIMLYSEALANV